MLKKYTFSVCLAAMLSISTSNAEEFAPYHPGAFSGFWIKQPVLNIHQLSSITEGRSRNELWSDDYWARYAGGLAYRYASPGFWINPKKPKPNDWKIPSEYILKKMPAAKMVRANRTHMLSPAEKYDLLVGDVGSPNNPKQPGYTLTRAFLSEITAKTQPWEGSCDGWAFAAMNEKPPVKAVTVKNVAGQEILFYPSDIRALLTLLYSDYKIASFGSDCYDKKPAMDGAGRAIDPGCRDTNPGIFHAVLVNQLGIGKRGFTMDTDYSAETWNYPVKSYKLQYYNPQTNKSYVDPRHSIVSKENYTRDRYAAHRSDRVASIVGVNVQLEYQIEALPLTAAKLDKSYERTFTNGYRYDLELDVDGNIIGGEWDRESQRNHPDLLSFVATSYINKSPYDRQIRGNTLPQILRSIKPQFVTETSAKRRPLYKVIKALAAMSQ
ncbi:hypothetical protein [Leucothrix pacifica]|uniref:Uncharacterized protein n=1 Tax=Leucothrix pacifica TaxID=1247513 RepID=A0A317CDA4_9GAMM|nr:hypothetical protein [Leucothrix pacifica]PWQ96624.1 hypothetical protein DKW60_12635 [Leucothrix pacifica]